MELTAIKVKIGTRENGEADHPDFNSLQIVKDSKMDWAYYIGKFGSDWIYDKKCGHKESDAESPKGIQWGCLCIPDEFAKQAVAAMPDIIEIIDESTLEIFHNERCTHDLARTTVDEKILNNIKLEFDYKKAVGSDVSTIQTRMDKALDPSNREPGVKLNRMKKWKDRKVVQDITIKQKVTEISR